MNPKRVEAGRLGVGVSRKFSEVELAVRSERLAKVRHLSVAARRKKRIDLEKKRREQKALVEASAGLGIFVPVSEFE